MGLHDINMRLACAINPALRSCLQVVYLEYLVAQSTAGSEYMQASRLHTGLPAVPLPSPQKDPAPPSPSTPPGKGLRHDLSKISREKFHLGKLLSS